MMWSLESGKFLPNGSFCSLPLVSVDNILQIKEFWSVANCSHKRSNTATKTHSLESFSKTFIRHFSLSWSFSLVARKRDDCQLAIKLVTRSFSVFNERCTTAYLCSSSFAPCNFLAHHFHRSLFLVSTLENSKTHPTVGGHDSDRFVPKRHHLNSTQSKPNRRGI